MGKVVRFFGYNNAIPIAFSILILGGTGAFAAADPQAVYSSQQKIVSEDNTYIANKDLSTFTPRAVITSVTEDADNYYVSYSLTTIDVKDYVWQDVVENNSLTVSKALLGKNKDLGLYVTDQLNQLIGHNKEYLAEVQEKARKLVTQKVISTTYGGLVGKFLDEKTEALPGYSPIVVPPPPPPTQAAAAASASNSDTPPSGSSVSSDGIQIMGNNPSRIPLKSPYVDLGVYVSNPHFQQFGIHLKLDGKEVNEVYIDTTATSTHTVTYTVTDDQGSSLVAERTIQIYDPATDTGNPNPPPPPSLQLPVILPSNVSPPPPPPVPSPEPAPPPSPEPPPPPTEPSPPPSEPPPSSAATTSDTTTTPSAATDTTTQTDTTPPQTDTTLTTSDTTTP